MGLLDSVVGSLTAGNAQGGNGLLDTVMQLIQNQPGGLAGLVQSFQQGGLADVVNSWVSTGQNLPVSGQQLASVLGSGPLQDSAAQLGVSPEQASRCWMKARSMSRCAACSSAGQVFIAVA